MFSSRPHQETVDRDLASNLGFVHEMLAAAGECLLVSGEPEVAAIVLGDILRARNLTAEVAARTGLTPDALRVALERADPAGLNAVFAALNDMTGARITVSSAA
jgi:DNA-binding phage protein